MRQTCSAAWCGVLLVILAGCAATPAYVPETQPLEPGHLPAPDVVVKVPGLGSCTDASDRSVHLNTHINRSPCRYTAAKAPPGAFHSLAQLYAFHGQQRCAW